MKKLINLPDSVVEDMLDGMVRAYPALRKLPDLNCIVRRDAPTHGKVGLVSGGGSGHEPAHAGFVGHGMLDAACAGKVFSSPTPDHFFEACKAVNSGPDGGAGVVMIVKNYSGDLMNTEIAAEMCEEENIPVARVVVNDDVAVEDSTYTTGRRGVAGTVYVHKVAGARAMLGGDLKAVVASAEKAVANVRSMGVALSPCIVPAAGKPGFTLGATEMEVGMGIHGEPGVSRREMMTAEAAATAMLEPILADMKLSRGDEVAVMINGLGATPLMELFIINKTVASLLDAAGVSIWRTDVGEFMTSLEMAGCSVTLMKLDAELKELLAAPSRTPAFTVCGD